jgi:hypothetical protein
MGKWKLTANLDDGTTSQGEAQFKKNGTYVMSDSSEDGPMHGRFAYANGILWLMMDDSHATFKLVWSNGNRFSFASNGVEMSFER